MWIFTLTCALIVYTVESSTERDEFEYLLRTYASNEWITSPIPDIHQEADEWPDGLYSVLMSKYGCPRGRWNRGYISFTWRTSHVILSHTYPQQCNNSSITSPENNTQCHQLLSEQTWPKSHTNIFGPFSQYKMTLNFCQKMNNTVAVDPYINRTWPDAYFNLFGADDGCPRGFYPNEKTMILPEVNTWTANGFLPFYVVESQNDRTVFKYQECVRERLEEMKPVNVLTMSNSTFILLKHEDFPCPAFEFYEVSPEIISIGTYLGTDSTIIQLLNFCYYQPESWDISKSKQYWIQFRELEDLQRAFQAYDIGQLVVLYGGIEAAQETRGISDTPHDYTMFCSQQTTCRTLIDMGKSFVIKTVIVMNVIPDGTIYNYTAQAGNDKWSLLRYGGIEIPSKTDESQFVGRYVVVVIPSFSYSLQQFDIYVLVADTDMMCMFDLGMADGSIKSNLISSSDKTVVDTRIDSVRAHQSGWCASNEDLNPYIQVDLMEETQLDGITIYNWYRNEVNITTGVHTTVPMGVHKFAFLYWPDGNVSSSYSNMSFHVEMFRPLDEAQTFMFHQLIRTRYVRVLPLEPITHDGQLCIRFELHGCRQDGAIYIPILTKREPWATDKAGATKTLLSPSQVTSIGYPLSYEDGTSYTWLVDFRHLGFIKLIFQEISLQSYEDRSFHSSWYHCNDFFTIRNSDRNTLWNVPTSVDHKHIIIETEEQFIAMEFKSCRPHTPRYKERLYFNAFVETSDIPTCTHIGEFRNGVLYSVKHCDAPTMMLSPLSMANVPTAANGEVWNIIMPSGTIRLSIKYFNIYCDSETYLEVSGRFLDAAHYNNCNPPNAIILSESDRVTLYYEVDRFHSDNNLQKEGFRIVYSRVESSHQQLLDTIRHKPLDYVKRTLGVPSLAYKACSVRFMKCYTIYTGLPVSWQEAGAECLEREKKLVSIRSEEEVFVVKYMLRTVRYEGPNSNSYVVDDSYYSHIGISREVKPNALWKFVGQDGSPITFSAWNTGQPKTDGNCVLMTFHQVHKNNTWEVEDCFTQMAMYFVCEEPVNSLPLSEIEPWSASNYTGRLSTTIHGYTCQRWDSQYPHYHYWNNNESFPDPTVSEAANYCRDPMGERDVLWCYTTDPSVIMDFCSLKDAVSDRCKATHYSYNGTQNETYSGLTCQRWESTLPHIPKYYADADFPDGNITNAENYCRDPSNEGFAWCYTLHPDIRRESCYVPVRSTTEDRTRDMYTCKDGSLIARQKMCNGIADCVDASDERKCPNQLQKLLTQQTVIDDIGILVDTQFICGSQETVTLLAHCDGIVDCIDGSDETNCDNGMGVSTECSWDEIQCGDGSCIHASLACDFIPHCMDHTDEDCDYPKCNDSEFMCQNRQCVPMEKRCNAHDDCIDGSDEHTCEGCSNDAFHCDSTKCIAKRLVCDNMPDCLDMNDELNCPEKRFSSCEEGWLNGLSRNGYYYLSDGTMVECNFDNTHENGTITTTSRAALDTDWTFNELYELENRFIVDLTRPTYLQGSGYECYQTFIQRCTFPVQTAAEAIDKNFENEYEHCRCVALTVIPYRPETASIHACDNKSHILDDSHMYFTYTVRFSQVRLWYGAFLDKKTPFNNEIEIEVGPSTCKNDPKSTLYMNKQNTSIDGIPCQRWDQQSPHAHNYTQYAMFPDNSVESAENFCRDPSQSGYIWCYTTDPMIRWQNCSDNDNIIYATRFPCEEMGLTYSANIRCIYDTDDAGYIIGCRNGRHLQDCSEFDCPYGMFKCPGSYCIPLRYICDRINQCPGNEDEHGCGCNNDNLELILLVSTEDWQFLDNNLTLRQLAGQFNNQGAIVRIVSYTIHYDEDMIPYDHAILEMRDIEVNMKQVVNIEHECSYRILASDYLDRVRFTNVASRGMIFVQNGTVSEYVARHMFQNMSKPDVDVYRVIIRSINKHEQKTSDEYNHVTDITINSLNRLTYIGSKLFSSLCKDSSSNYCLENYKCSSSTLCIEHDKICDGHVHCPFYDDEMFCKFECPTSCFCSGYSANCSSATFENSTDFSVRVNKKFRVLDLSNNVHFGEVVNSNDDFILEFPYMIRLNLSLCNIQILRPYYFEGMPNLRSLDISQNRISTIHLRTFHGLTKLVYLNLRSAFKSMTLDSFAFLGLVSLRHLDISGMNIKTISPYTFSGLQMDKLQVSNNNILQLSNNAFSGLSVSTIVFESNNVETFDKDIFNGISELKTLRTSAYKYCCIRPDYLPESACFPERDEFSSCDDLMRNSALQTLLWLVGICALLGNILAVVYRVVYVRESLNLGYGVFVTNLAIADFCMGVYLLIIAIADSLFRKRYIFMDDYWRNSSWCTFAGVLSTVSSEASVMFVCLITLDRFLVIKYPLSRIRFTPRKAFVATVVAWLLSISIAVIPLVARQYFENMFYRKSGVCVALPLTRDRQAGWLYAVVIFIGVNFITFIGIALGQLSIYLEINNASSKMKNKRSGQSNANRKKELTLARNLLLVVATDFLCWAPIGCMGLMALTGTIIPGDVYAWVVVFVLPVNSALNPVLYTLTVILGKKKQHETPDKPVNKQKVAIRAAKRRGVDRIAKYIMPQTEVNGQTLVSIESVIQQKLEVTPSALLNLTTQLTHYLQLLYKNSMILEQLNASAVFVTVEHGKVTGDIKIYEPPVYSTSSVNRRENIYTVGVLVSRLLESNSK